MADPLPCIRVVDLECTGLDHHAGHEPIEIGWCDLVARPDLAGGFLYDQLEAPCRSGHLIVKPGRPIPPDSSAVHHLTDSDVEDGYPWPLAAVMAMAPGAFGIAAYAAHSAKFERQWLTDELCAGRPWICTWKAACRLWPDAPGHSNQALRYWKLADEPDLIGRYTNTHRAEPDATVTAYVLRRMLAEASLADLVQWTSEPTLLPRIPFGNSRGLKWSECDDGFLLWVLERDFDADVMFTARSELERREKLREQEETAEGAEGGAENAEAASA